MLPLIAARRSEIAALCRRLDVRRLEVFGSAAREEDFDPQRSDLDFLVEFDTVAAALSIDRFFDLRDGLERMLGHPVDLVTAGAVRNPYLRDSIDRCKEPVYGP